MSVVSADRSGFVVGSSDTFAGLRTARSAQMGPKHRNFMLQVFCSKDHA